MLNKHQHSEYKILADLLKMADEEFGNHGCNDYEIDDTPENRAFMEDVLKWNAPDCPDEWELQFHNGKILTQDYFLMGYFAHLAEELSNASRS